MLSAEREEFHPSGFFPPKKTNSHPGLDYAARCRRTNKINAVMTKDDTFSCRVSNFSRNRKEESFMIRTKIQKYQSKKKNYLLFSILVNRLLVRAFQAHASKRAHELKLFAVMGSRDDDGDDSWELQPPSLRSRNEKWQRPPQTILLSSRPSS